MTTAGRGGAEVEPTLEGHRRELTGYCYRMLGASSEAEDAVQETMVRAWQAYDRFEGRSSLRSWLYRIASNVCLDMHRSPQRRARPMEMGPSTPTAEVVLGPQLPELTFVQPVLDARVIDLEGRSGRRGNRPRVDPPGLRGRPAAPAGPPTRPP